MSNDTMNNHVGESREEMFARMLREVTGREESDLEQKIRKFRNDPEKGEYDEGAKRKQERALQLVEQIQTFFDKKGWHYIVTDSKGLVMLLRFGMSSSTISMEIVVEPRGEQIRFEVELLNCQKEYRLAMSSFLTEVNYPLRYGAFRLNMKDGEVTYRYSMSYKELLFSEEALAEYIAACISTANRYYKEIGKIAYGGFSDQEKKEWFEKMKELAVALSL